MQPFIQRRICRPFWGGEGFKDWLRKNFQELRFKQDVPKLKELALSGHVIRKLVCREFKVKNDVLMFSRRGTENLSRDVAIFLQRKYCGQTLAELGRDYNIASYSSVSSHFERAKSRLVTDQQLKEKVSRIELKLNKGQRET